METSEAARLKSFALVTHRFQQLSHRLTEVAERASMAGGPPSESMVDYIATSRRSCNELREPARELVCLLATSTGTKPGEIESIKDVGSLLEFMASATEENAGRTRPRPDFYRP